MSSRILFQEFPEIKIRLWRGHLWSRSYCLLTTGQTTLDVFKKYVESQGEEEDINNRKEKDTCKMCFTGW